MSFFFRSARSAIFLCAAATLLAQGPENILVVVNDNSPLSREIGEYYARRRAVPMDHLCHIRTETTENITREKFDAEIAAPIAKLLRQQRLTETTLYIVTTAGVPLRIPGTGQGMATNNASVDSELTLLYRDMLSGAPHPTAGSVPNPFFGKRDQKFTHPQFPIYLVTRLAAYDFDSVRDMIDRSLKGADRGKFVIDLKGSNDNGGDAWLKDAAILLPKDRVVFDETKKVLYDQTDVIAYAGWGSNDPNRHQRFLHFKWLPGAIATEFVSTNARTFAKPPDDWTIVSNNWEAPKLFFAGSPQSMTADYILDGATGASGHTDEPYLMMCPRPDFVLPAYAKGRNLAESFYLGIRGLSWQNVVVGDPLCNIARH